MTWAIAGISLAAFAAIGALTALVVRAQSAAKRSAKAHIAAVSARDAIWERLSQEVAARTELAHANEDLARRIERLSAEYGRHRAAADALIEQSYGRFLERLAANRVAGTPGDDALAAYAELLQERLSRGDGNDPGGEGGREATPAVSRDTSSEDRRESD